MAQITIALTVAQLQGIFNTPVPIPNMSVPPGTFPILYGAWWHMVGGSTTYAAAGGTSLAIEYISTGVQAASMAASNVDIGNGVVSDCLTFAKDVINVPSGTGFQIAGVGSTWTTQGNGILTVTVMFHPAPGVSTP